MKNAQKTLFFLVLLLIFIMFDELCNNSIINVFSTQSDISSLVLISSFLVLQVIAAPIQAGYSDFYCRKKIIIIALSFSALSMGILYVYSQDICSLYVLLVFIILFKGIMGNTLPIAMSGLADTQIKNFRFAVGLATIGMDVGYFVLLVLHKMFSIPHSILIITIMFMLLIYFCAKKFTDIRDKKDNITGTMSEEKPLIKQEIKSILTDFLGNKRFRMAMLAFMLWEYSFYIVFILDVDLRITTFKYLSLFMIAGYIIGVIILKYAKKRDETMIKIGYRIALISIVPIFIVTLLCGHIRWTLLPCYFIYSLAFGFMVPCLFSILSGERKPHEQGKIYGLIDSVDTVAFLLTAMTAIMYNTFGFKAIFMVFASLIILLISSIPYASFKKTTPKHIQHDT